MLQIDNTIISLDFIEQHFCCDLKKCKGICCVHGDSGAPLEDDEVEILKDIFNKIKPFIRLEGIEAIEKQGTSVIDSDGDLVTPLIDGKECAYVIFDKGIAKCGIEAAFFAGKINFRKPISCHLYPARLTKYSEFTAVNYHRWDICKHAVQKGNSNNIKVHDFLKEALIRKFGENWFEQLKSAETLLNDSELPNPS